MRVNIIFSQILCYCVVFSKPPKCSKFEQETGFSISTFLPNLFLNVFGTLFPCRKLGRELSLYVSEAKTKQMDEIMDRRHAAQIGRLGVQTNLRSNK